VPGPKSFALGNCVLHPPQVPFGDGESRWVKLFLKSRYESPDKSLAWARNHDDPNLVATRVTEAKRSSKRLLVYVIVGRIIPLEGDGLASSIGKVLRERAAKGFVDELFGGFFQGESACTDEVGNDGAFAEGEQKLSVAPSETDSVPTFESFNFLRLNRTRIHINKSRMDSSQLSQFGCKQLMMFRDIAHGLGLYRANVLASSQERVRCCSAIQFGRLLKNEILV
jgi:hypothetical protein